MTHLKSNNHKNIYTKRPMLIFQISGNWNPERQTQLHRIREKTGYIKLCLVTKLCPTLLRARQASLSLGFPRQ